MIQSSQDIAGILVFIAGACVGSFLNVCICRLPKGRSVVYPGSACPQCGHRLAWWENIPLVSYFILKAKCHKCGKNIPLQYPIVEALSGVLALALWIKFGLSIELAIYSPFLASLLVITFIDLEHKIIPDVLSLSGILLGIACSFLNPDLEWYDSIFGVILGGGILYVIAVGYLLLAKKEGMGGGDIKLLAMIGAYLGWSAVPLVIFLSAAVGSVIGVALILIRRGDRNSAIPYGPFLSGAAVVALFYGKEIMSWYARFLTQTF